jgi:hypothetical protein
MRTSATAATAAAHLGRGRPDIVTEPSGVLRAGRCGILEFLTTRAGGTRLGRTCPASETEGAWKP